MLRSICRAMIAAGLVFGLCGVARAQVEPIFGPVLPPPGGATFVFPNFIPPNPDHKLLHFHGAVDSNGFPAVSTLTGNFDWLLPSGATATSPPETFTVFPFSTNPVDFSFIVDFCPSEVSLHFATTSAVGATVSGTFEHTCVPVPEPGSIAVLGLAAWALTMRGKRRRVRS